MLLLLDILMRFPFRNIEKSFIQPLNYIQYFYKEQSEKWINGVFYYSQKIELDLFLVCFLIFTFPNLIFQFSSSCYIGFPERLPSQIAYEFQTFDLSKFRCLSNILSVTFWPSFWNDTSTICTIIIGNMTY